MINLVKKSIKLGFFFFLPLPTIASIINVPSEQPTIQSGIDAANSGDTVLVAPGSYSGLGNINLSISGKSIMMKGQYGADSVKIDGEGINIGFGTISSGTEIRGFTIQNCLTAIYIGTVNPIIDSNIFLDNINYGIYFQAGGFPNLIRNSYSGNEYGIAVGGGETWIDGTWHRDGDEPYVVLGDVEVKGYLNRKLPQKVDCF